jgi:hypothetical protein
MKNKILLSILCIALANFVKAQEPSEKTKESTENAQKFEFVMKPVFGFGFKSYQSAFDAAVGKKVRPGGGIGMEIGFAYRPVSRFELYLAYQMNLGGYFNATVSNQGSSKFGHTFSRHLINVNFYYVQPINKKTLKAIKIGAGPSLCVFTKEKATFGGQSESLKYKFTAGFNAEFGLELGFKKRPNFILYPGLEFHYAQYKLKLPDNISVPLNKINASGMGFFLGLIRKF